MISIRNLAKRFHNHNVLKGINVDIKEGELVALLGPSGSGKTTILRMIAGLETPDRGNIFTYGIDITDKSPIDRKIGFVFQHYALFKHMTVFENIAFGLKIQRKKLNLTNKALRDKVDDLLNLLHIGHIKDQYPSHLSGGQRQRVALARSLAVQPQILLLDEPFAALDEKIRQELRRWLRNLQKKNNLTIIFVTHDQKEAMEVADRVIIMSDGQIEQIGTPEEVYHKPANSFVYNFLGNYNVFDGMQDQKGNTTIIEGQGSAGVLNFTKKKNLLKKGKIVRKFLKFISPQKINARKTGDQKQAYVEIFARPHDMELVKKPQGNLEYIKTTISYINKAGPLVKIELEKQDQTIIIAEVTHAEYKIMKLNQGDVVYTRAKEVTIFTK